MAPVSMQPIHASPDPPPRSAPHLDWWRDAAAARSVHIRLARPRVPRLPGFEVGVWSEPARILSGDFYDLVALDGSRSAIVVGDVSGKGLPAALIVASLQASLRTHLKLGADLRTTLTSVNALLYERTAPHHFATLFLGIYDARVHTLQYVNCGHNPPFLVRSAGRADSLMPTATILGAFKRWECTRDEVALSDSDLLCIYTDGLTEGRDHAGREYGENALLNAMRVCRTAPLTHVLKFVARTHRRFRNGLDDVTLLAVRSRREVAR